MARGISFLQYLRAHGNTAGPTQRPYLTGGISGLLADIPTAFVLYYSGAARSAASNLKTDIWIALLVDAGLMILAGMLYAAVFKRAANDQFGGWLFGISYGFLLWVLGPVTLWGMVTSRPVAVGVPAIGIFAAQVLYGFVLGLVYPFIHTLVQKRLLNGGEY